LRFELRILGLKNKRRAGFQRDPLTATNGLAAIETYKCLALSGFLNILGFVSSQKPNMIFEGAKLQFIFFQTRDLEFFFTNHSKNYSKTRFSFIE
jgi:hypothetical protein